MANEIDRFYNKDDSLESIRVDGVTDSQMFQSLNTERMSGSWSFDEAAQTGDYETFSKSVGYSGTPQSDYSVIQAGINQQAERKKQVRDRTAETFSEGMGGAVQVGKGDLSKQLIMMGLQDPILNQEIEGKINGIKDRQREIGLLKDGRMKDHMIAMNDRDQKLLTGYVSMQSNEIKNFVKAQEQIESAKLLEGFAEFTVEGKIPTTAKGFAGFLGSLLVSQGVTQAPTILKTLGSGPAAPITVFSETFQQERVSEMMQHMSENGVDFNSEESLLAALNDKELMKEASSRGMRKGLPVAIASALSAGFMPSGGTLTKLAKDTGQQVGFDVVGEVGGQIAATGNVNMQDVLVEVLAGIGQNAAESTLKAPELFSFKKHLNEGTQKILDNENFQEAVFNTIQKNQTEDEFAAQAKGEPVAEAVLRSAHAGDKGAQSVIQNSANKEEAASIVTPDPERKTLALNKEETANLRTELDLDSLPPRDRVTTSEVLESAKAKKLDQSADTLATEIIKNPRVMTPEEQAGATIRAVQLKTEYEQLIKDGSELAEAGKSEESQVKFEKAERKLDTLQTLFKAEDIAGTEVGRAFSARKIRINMDDFSLATLITRAQAAKGEKLTKEETTLFSNLADRIKELDAKVAELQHQLDQSKEPPTKRENRKMTDLRVESQQTRREAKQKVDNYRKKTKMELALEVASLPRSLLATGDMSAVLRQGVLLSVSRPITSAKIFGKSAHAFFSQHKADEIDLAIRLHPDQEHRDKAGLYLTPMDRIDLAAREEAFASTLTEKIPLFKHLVLASERNMVAHLNMLRAASFDQFRASHPEASIEDQRAFADYVNKASGRGSLGKAAGAARTASAVFFAPRYALSRFQAPMTLVSNWKSPIVRNAIAKDFSAFIATGGTIMLLASLAGFEVGLDPEDSDFGKIIVGNTRIDLWGGFIQAARLTMAPIVAGHQRVTKGESDVDLVQAAMQFASYKLSPAVTVPAQLITGQDMIGQDRTTLQTIGDSVVPLVIQEAVDTYEEEQSVLAAGGAFAGAFFGIGVSSYDK